VLLDEGVGIYLVELKGGKDDPAGGWTEQASTTTHTKILKW
jgi:hypothetical protein